MTKTFITSLVFLLSFSMVNPENLNKNIKSYKIKVYKGNWKFYEGVKECYFFHNKELSIVKFGGTGRYDYKVEIEEVKDEL